MHNFPKKQFFRSTYLLSFLLSLGLTFSLGNVVKAETAETAPQELKEILTNFEATANQRNVQEMMNFYSEKFTNSDGLDYSSLSDLLKSMWSDYPTLKYSVQLESWEKDGDTIVTETITYIQGYNRKNGRLIFINSSLKSKQYWSNKKIIRQEILSEQTRLTTGINPPNIKVVAPETAKVGEQFNFDVIVSEPLGEDVLLGAVIKEPTQADFYVNHSSIELEVLPAGGLFKLVNPDKAGDEWLSAILVRGDGITSVTQRIRVEE